MILFVNANMLKALACVDTVSHLTWIAIVADRFHVMKEFNEELYQKIKSEKRQAEKLKNKKERERKLEGIKNIKYPFLKKKETLND